MIEEEAETRIIARIIRMSFCHVQDVVGLGGLKAMNEEQAAFDLRLIGPTKGSDDVYVQNLSVGKNLWVSVVDKEQSVEYVQVDYYVSLNHSEEEDKWVQENIRTVRQLRFVAMESAPGDWVEIIPGSENNIYREGGGGVRSECIGQRGDKRDSQTGCGDAIISSIKATKLIVQFAGWESISKCEGGNCRLVSLS